jgi:hypothetical protein
LIQSSFSVDTSVVSSPLEKSGISSPVYVGIESGSTAGAVFTGLDVAGLGLVAAATVSCACAVVVLGAT